jgi:hypothetical protein
MPMRQKEEDDPTIFVWRGSYSFDDEMHARYPDSVPELYQRLAFSASIDCPFCRSVRVTTERETGSDETKCRFCGFKISTIQGSGIQDTHWRIYTIALLRRFQLTDDELEMNELGSHLRQRFDDIYRLSPRRFEELVADIYRNRGFHVRLTQQTRDGGYDLILLEKATGDIALVECKRYAKTNKVQVGTIRELLGVQLLLSIRKAKIITTGYFTTPAQDSAHRLMSGVSGFELELIDVDRLARELDVYNTALPPLDIHCRHLGSSS